MAIVHADNFSLYGTNTAFMINGIYGGVTGDLIADPDGVSPGYVLRTSLPNGGGIQPLPVAASRVGISKRVWLNGLPPEQSAAPTPFSFYDLADGNPFCMVCVETTGALSVRRTQGGGTVIFATTPGPVVTANGWYHIEVAVEPASGSVEIRVEGQTVLDVTGLPFLYTGDIYRVGWNGRFGAALGYPGYSQKDYVVWDDNGSDNNDFLGSVLVTQLTLDTDIDLNWTPSTGSTGYGILDNIPPNDAQYLSAPYNAGGPPYFPDPYVGSMTSLPVETTSVRALVTYVRAAKSDGGDGSLQVGIISDPDGTPATVLGADRPITVAQTYWRDVFERDPVTDAPWLPSAVNEAQLQINRTS